MIYLFIALIISFLLLIVSYAHYTIKTEHNNIPISIIKEIETNIMAGKYTILNPKRIINIQLLYQDVSKNKSRNEYRFIVRSDTEVCLVKIEVYKEKNEYISKYKSHRFLLEKEIKFYFFYSTMVRVYFKLFAD